MDGNNRGSFWPSYVDIMTTLFAIMLVLFAVSYSRFKIKERQFNHTVESLKKTEGQLKEIIDEYDNILTIYSIVGKIDSSVYFGYNQEYLKHMFQIDVEYQPKEYDIYKLQLDQTNHVAAERKRDSVLNAGKMVQETILELNRRMPATKDNNIKFLVIIEGQSSRIPFEGAGSMRDWKNNYTLSYLRAQYLNDFWKKKGVCLDTISRCEVIISGSGEEGFPRIIPNVAELRQLYPNEREFNRQRNNIEKRNQRFLINIVPVLGNIDSTREKINRVKGNR